MSHIIILFGEMGTGKNYCGERLAKSLGYRFFDGDDVVTEEMKDRVSKFKPLSRAIISEYVMKLFFHIYDYAHNNNLVVAQALYSDEDREYLEKFLVATGHTVSFKLIKTSFWQHMERLWSRPRGLRWVIYGLMNKPFFEMPKLHKYEIIENLK